MHHQPERVTFKIDAIITQPKTVQRLIVAFQLSEAFEFRAHHFLRQSPELPQDLQLQFLGHPRQFRRAGRIKNDLKGSHRAGFSEVLEHRIW